MGPECKITMFCSPLCLPAPNQLLAHCQAHSSDSINVERQGEDTLHSCVRDVRRKSL